MTPWTLVPVRWRGVMLNGSPARGSIVLRPSVERFLTGPVSVFAALLSATVDDDGTATLYVPATDDPAFTVDGFTYEVVEDLRGEQGSRYSIEVPLSLAATGVDLNTALPVAPSPGVPVSLVTRAEFEAVKETADEALQSGDTSALAAEVEAVDSRVVGVESTLSTRLSEATLTDKVSRAVEDAVEAHTPGMELGYAERVTQYDTDAADATAAPAIPGLSVTVVGQGRPADVEFYTPSVTHTTAFQSVSVGLGVNGSPLSDMGQFGGEQSYATVPGSGPSLLVKRRVTLAAGVSYTFTVHPFAFGGVGTATVYALDPFMPMSLSVVSR